MNHEVEDDIDVERARREDGEPVGFKEHGTAKLRLNGQNGRIEAFEVTGLENAIVLFGNRDQFVGLRRGSREGLFDEQVETGFEQYRCNGVMLRSWNGYSCGVELEIGGEQFFDGGEDRDCIFGFGFRGAGRIGFDGRNESGALIGRFEFAVDTKMIASERPGSNYGNATIAFACDCYAPLPSTARRQRV